MRKITYRMNLDVQQCGIQQTLVGFHTGDSLSRTVCIHLVERGAAYQVPADCIVTLYAEKPDGTVSYSMCTVENGYLQHTFTSGELAVPGEVICEVRIISGDSNPVIVYCPQFAVVVEGVLHSDAAIESTNEYSALTEMTAGLEEKKTAAQSAAQLAEEAAEEARRAGAQARETVEQHTTDTTIHMSASEKTKLSGIEAGANKYEHPAYAEKSAGMYKVTVDGNGHVSAASPITKEDIVGLGISAEGGSYEEATPGTSGLMSASDKEKLDRYPDNGYYEPAQTVKIYNPGTDGEPTQTGEDLYFEETEGYLNFYAGEGVTLSEYADPANIHRRGIKIEAQAAAGAKGEDGTTFTPSVSAAGVISWTNDGGLENPASVSIKGAAGAKGDKGDRGEPGAPGKSAYEIYTENGGTLTSEQWLASLARIRPEFANDITECTDTSGVYVLPDGYIYAYMTVTETVKTYTNLTDPLSDDWTADARINSSGGTTAATGVITTNYIPCTAGDLIRVQGLDLTGYNTAVYSSEKSICCAAKLPSYPSGYLSGITASTTFSVFQVIGEGLSFIRFSGIPNGSSSDIIITKNQAISETTTTEEKWANTGNAFVPADYEDRILAAENSIGSMEVKLEALETGTDSALLPPDYWLTAIESRADSVRERQASGADAFQFVWFSDMHGVNGYPNTNGAGTSGQTGIGKVSGYLCDRFDIPFVATSGDIMSQESHTAVQKVYDEYSSIRDVLSGIPTEKLLAVRGNHDGSWGAASDGIYYLKHIGTGEIYNQIYRRQALDRQRVFGGDGTYFYADSVPGKVRFILLNSNTDGDGSMDASGNAVYNSQKVSVYGTEQLAWLGDCALHMPTGWTAVIMAHQPISTSEDGALLAGILEAYRTRKTYSGTVNIQHDYWGKSVSDNTYKTVTADVDFTEATGEVAAFFHGHVHKDTMDTATYSFPSISITTAGGDVRDENPAQRTPGTATETALDVVTVDRAARRIYLTRFGVGSDRVCSY